MNQDHTDNMRGGYRASLSDENFVPREVVFHDRKVTGAQVAEAAGARSVEEFVVLRHLRTGELETLRPTETTDLGDEGTEQFFVIRASETFRFVIEGLSLEWPRRRPLGKHLKILGRAEADQTLLLVLPSGEREIADNEEVDLQQPGLERFRLRRFVTVTYNRDQVFKLEDRVYTTEELMRVFGVPDGYRLDLYTGKGMRELNPGEEITVRNKMEFSSHVPTGSSS